MDLISTRVTEPKNIESKFKHSVLRSGIVKVSAELKNSFKSKTHHSGFSAELAVIRLLEKKGWILLFHRAKTRISEIDLILEKDGRILLIEVKRLNDDWRVFQRISLKQKIKLQANVLFFSLQIKEFSYESYVAWVDLKNRISFCKVD